MRVIDNSNNRRAKLKVDRRVADPGFKFDRQFRVMWECVCHGGRINSKAAAAVKFRDCGIPQ